jgi:hypothetical protein
MNFGRTKPKISIISTAPNWRQHSACCSARNESGAGAIAWPTKDVIFARTRRRPGLRNGVRPDIVDNITSCCLPLFSERFSFCSWAECGAAPSKRRRRQRRLPCSPVARVERSEMRDRCPGFRLRSIRATSLQFPAELAVERIGSPAAQRDGKEDQAPEQRILPAAGAPEPHEDRRKDLLNPNGSSPGSAGEAAKV